MTLGAALTALVPSVAIVAAGALLVSIGLCLAWLAVQHRILTLRPGQIGTTKAVITAIEMAGFLVPVSVGTVADHTNLVAAVGVYGILGLLVTPSPWPATAARRAARPRLRMPSRHRIDI